MKIFWRIFMRQISLTDYFCKGLNLIISWFLSALSSDSKPNNKSRLKFFSDGLKT
ncbi:hypothetical protein DE8669_0504 [Neisseria meningitidis]|nr:hypothetical protein DE8669_0504 [Neisseria meningitidis]